MVCKKQTKTRQPYPVLLGRWAQNAPLHIDLYIYIHKCRHIYLCIYIYMYMRHGQNYLLAAVSLLSLRVLYRFPAFPAFFKGIVFLKVPLFAMGLCMFRVSMKHRILNSTEVCLTVLHIVYIYMRVRIVVNLTPFTLSSNLHIEWVNKLIESNLFTKHNSI